MSDDRGVSTALGYVLAISITTVLIAMLLLTATGFVSTQQDFVVDAEMEITGQDVADHITAVDRLAALQPVYNYDEEYRIERSVSVPNEFAGSGYTIIIEHVSGQTRDDAYTYTVRMITTSPPASHDTRFVTETPIRGATNPGDSISLSGNDLIVRFEDGELVIQNG